MAGHEKVAIAADNREGLYEPTQSSGSSRSSFGFLRFFSKVLDFIKPNKMGWKLKNESTVNANVECTRTLPHLVVRKVGLDVDAIYDCFLDAVIIDIESEEGRPGEFANTANALTDEQVRVFTQAYQITPETRQGIILWNEVCYDDDINGSDYEEDESDDYDDDEDEGYYSLSDHSNNEDGTDYEEDESDDDDDDEKNSWIFYCDNYHDELNDKLNKLRFFE